MSTKICSHYSLITPIKNNFISFEGIDGSGKTTQIKLLTDALKSAHFNTVSLREPGGTIFGENLRNAILNSETMLDPVAEAYLFASSRAQLMREKIRPHIEDDLSVVICDRFIHSSLAYQGYARKLGNEFVINTHSIEPLNLVPNITFFLDVPVEESIRRQKSRSESEDYFEKEKKDFFTTLRNGFLESQESVPSFFKKIDATQPIDKIHREVISALHELDRKYEALK